MRWTAVPVACGLITVGVFILSTPSVEAQTAGREPIAGAPLESGVTFVDLDHPVTSSGELRLWRVLSTEGARVMLKVFRPEADRLRAIAPRDLDFFCC